MEAIINNQVLATVVPIAIVMVTIVAGVIVVTTASHLSYVLDIMSHNTEKQANYPSCHY